MHVYSQAPDGTPTCTVCGLPPRNRIHHPTTPAPAPAASAVARVVSDTSRVFNDLWDTTKPAARVLHRILTCGEGGVTDDELMRAPELADMPSNTVRPRRIDLAHAGLVVHATNSDGTVQRRSTSTGRPAQVWVASAECLRLVRRVTGQPAA